MKECCRCRTAKELDFFHKDSAKKDGHQSYCKECAKSYSKKWVDRSPESKVRYNTWKQERLTAVRAIYKEFMQDKSCVDCGCDNWLVLEWDHLGNIAKVAGVQAMISRGNDWEKVLKEIDKCEPRCLNCHRIVTATRGNWWMIQ